MKSEVEIKKIHESINPVVAKMQQREEECSINSLVANKRDLTLYPEFVSSMLAKDKQDVYRALFTRENIGITSEVKRKIQPIFEARDRVESFSFSTPKAEEDFHEYREYVLNDNEFFRTDVLKNVFCAPDSVIVTDILKGEAFFYLVQPSKIVNIQYRKEYLRAEYGRNVISYVIFKDDTGRYFLIDEVAYYSYDFDGGIKDLIVNPHNLKYTPATSIWLEKTNYLNDTPIIKALSKLRWAQFFAVSKNFNSTFALYPIFSGYEAACKYEDEKAYCSQGVLISNVDGTNAGACPSCSGKKTMFAGTYVEVPAPHDSESPDLRNPIQRLDPDVPSLEFIKSDLESQYLSIENTMIGEYSATTREAVNEKQVKAGSQSRHEALSDIAFNFERIHKFCLDTAARLMYGDSFKKSQFTYGRNFISIEFTDLIQNYKDLKELGLEGAAENVRHQITKLAVNSEDDRANIIDQLDSLPTVSLLQSLELYKEGVISKEDILKKSLLVRFIEHAETMLPITAHGAEGIGNYNALINLFNKFTNEYIQELNDFQKVQLFGNQRNDQNGDGKNLDGQP